MYDLSKIRKFDTKTKTELRSIPVPTTVLKQIGVDSCNLPEVDKYCCLVVLGID